MTTEIPSLGDVLRETIAAALGRVHTSFPARVLSYDATTQKATIQSVVRFRRMNSDDELETYLPPPIANVPVLFFSSGSHSITFPISEGDQGFVMCAERSIDEWKSTGSKDSEPTDPRRFDLSDAVFIPAGRAFVDPVPTTGVDPTNLVISGNIKLGSGAANEKVALSGGVNGVYTQLQQLQAALTSWVPVPTDGGAALKTILTTLFTTAPGLPLGWPREPGADKVRAE